MAVSFNLGLSEASILANVVTVGKRIDDKQFIINEINNFIKSKKRQDMLVGERYYRGLHDILLRKRLVIGEDGKLVEIENLPNNRVVDNQYAKMVKQKKDYISGKPVTFNSDNEEYEKVLKKVFNKRFDKKFKTVVEDSLNCGIAWLFVNYNEEGQLIFKRLNPYEIIPLWNDTEHTVLDGAIRIYQVIELDNNGEENVLNKIEIFDANGISYFDFVDDDLIPCEPYKQPYFFVSVKEDDGNIYEYEYNWNRIPLIPFKYNDKEIPLINMVKSLQDGINIIESNFQNNMEEDTRNTILILHNYDGQNLAEFRRNLATYGAIKVRTVDGSDGDVKSLKIEVNAENYEAILEIFRRAIIENAMGYDAKDERLNGVPNQMNILSMYSDIDLDANDMETEFQASFEDLLFYINSYLENTGKGNFDDAELNIIFNRDIMLSESEAIENCVRSEGILSRETIISQHPWIENVGAELERIKRENRENEDIYGNSFNNINTGMPEDMKRIKIEKDKKSEILNQDKVKKKEEEHE